MRRAPGEAKTAKSWFQWAIHWKPSLTLLTFFFFASIQYVNTNVWDDQTRELGMYYLKSESTGLPSHWCNNPAWMNEWRNEWMNEWTNKVRVDNAVVSQSFTRRNLYDVSKFSTGYFPVKKYQTDDVTRNVLRVSALTFCLAIYLLLKKIPTEIKMFAELLSRTEQKCIPWFWCTWYRYLETMKLRFHTCWSH